MLKKESKLSSPDLLKLKKEGKRVYSTLFSVTFRPAENSRFAVTIPKKVYKNAVDRNRAKRKVFAVLPSLSPKITADYEIFIKSQINGIKNEEIAEDLKKLLCQR